MSEDESTRTDLPSSVPGILPWQKKPRFSWTPAFETTFFRSLCQSVQLGLRENMSFKPEAWVRALTALRDEGAYPTKPHLINKTDNARKKFRLWRGLVENPQFNYNPVTRTISGSEDAWTAHLEKEPHARAFRDRGFENTEYLEVLFPDVIGSGGQPKRVAKARRKGPDNIPDNEAPPGTSIMHLANGPGGGVGNAAGTPMRLGSNAGAGIPGASPNINSTLVPIPTNNNNNHPSQMRHQSNSSGNAAAAAAAAARVQAAAVANAGVHIRPTQQGGPNTGPGQSPASTIQPPPPPGILRQGGATGRVRSNAASITALTPPEETNSNNGTGQKRFAPGGDASTAAATTSSKRRRTDSNINPAGGGAGRNNRTGSQQGGLAVASSGVSAPSSIHVGANNAEPSSVGPASSTGGRQAYVGGNALTSSTGTGAARADGIAGLLGDVLSKYASAATLASTTRWPEQAMEIFFNEFADEDMDLQLRIAEKILTDNSKAVMFCKMPETLRKHWVKRLREAISRQGN